MAISTRKRNHSTKKSLLPMLQPRTLQTTLFGEQAEEMPNVRTSDGFILPWNSEAIVQQLLRETSLAQTFYGKRGMKRPEARRRLRRSGSKVRRRRLRPSWPVSARRKPKTVGCKWRFKWPLTWSSGSPVARNFWNWA